MKETLICGILTFSAVLYGTLFMLDGLIDTSGMKLYPVLGGSRWKTGKSNVVSMKDDLRK